MQEGILSLMQMPRTTIAVQRLREARLPYIVVLTDPTTGGVTASYAMLGDIHIAEPGALICFAGPRVIQQTIREQLPEGFQRAEYLLAHGMIDMVVHRHKLRETLAALCRLLTCTARDRPSRQEPQGQRRNGHGATATSTAARVDGKLIEALVGHGDGHRAEPVAEASASERAERRRDEHGADGADDAVRGADSSRTCEPSIAEAGMPTNSTGGADAALQLAGCPTCGCLRR